MKTIGIEINHVIRNINKQIAKYYAKEFDPTIDIDELNLSDDIIGKVAKFPSEHAKRQFIYIDYPYEIFGCANTMEKGLAAKIACWLPELDNIEDEDIRVAFYSLDEDALTIQSTLFFLSKIGARVRKVIFPKNISDVFDECDLVITANPKVVDYANDNSKDVILIKRDSNRGKWESAKKSYDNLSDVIEDKNFFKL